ncbi:sensor histidine kinase [Cohnella faecalis]|uniref:HAMP domain-containing protein n=1 Tax=Cohnella faecalis TaxID=2315694 RepID=A0A398CEV1_9BACL|nr:histidine kinase [Cohnella faecalis]RIE00402.1 HAMP domain-containing protein [Cohnella faecalis]
MLHLQDIRRSSIRMKMLAGLFLIVIPLIGFIIYSNVYAIEVVRNQVAKSSKDLLSLYRDQLDARLKEVDNYLTGIMLDPDLSNLEFVSSPDQRLISKQQIYTNLSNAIFRYPLLDGLFVYIPSDDHFLYSFTSQSTMNDRMYMKSLISETVSQNRVSGNQKDWFIQKNGDQVYIVRYLMLNNTSIVGAWFNARSLQTPLDLLGIGEQGATLLGDDHGSAITDSEFIRENGVVIRPEASSYYLTGTKRRFIAVGERSHEGDFSLYAFIPENRILQHLPTLKMISYFLPFASIVILLLGLLFLRNSLLVPLNRLLKAMNRIKQGNLDMQIKQEATSMEFQMVNDTFNNMMEQIKNLRISVYEEQLNKQKAELQHLQLQIKPHFFINTLNMMHVMARMKDVVRMEEMSLCLIRYFRYMFQSNLSFVSLKEELQHVRNYLRIQEMRYPDLLKYEIQAPDFLMGTPVPPLVVHTLVENAIKHAVTLNDPVWIYIDLEMMEPPDSGLLIQVRDTGPGFREGVIQQVVNNQRIFDEEGEHIGIWNLKQRLKLLYEDQAVVVLKNLQPNGASVEITLPFSPSSRTNSSGGRG